MAENSESINELKGEIAGSRQRVARELQRPALRTGFPGEIPEVIPKTDGFLDQRGGSSRGADRVGADAEEESLCGRKESA